MSPTGPTIPRIQIHIPTLPLPQILINRDPKLETQGLSSHQPFVLFPVRLETRWIEESATARFLKIRVFPDEVLAERMHAKGGSTEPFGGPSVFRLLPDRWIFRLTRRDGKVRDVPTVFRVHANLTLSPALGDPGAHHWSTNFDSAVTAGMAAKIAVDGDEWDQGFSALHVLGVRTGTTVEENSTGMQRLFASHAAEKGAELLVPGTPTKRTASDATESQAATGATGTAPGADASALATAIGTQATAFAGFAGAGNDTLGAARAMSRALWGATWGYFLDQMTEPDGLSEATLRAARDFATRFASGRGHAPAFRVGQVPYGVVLATSLKDWSADAAAAEPASTVHRLVTKLLPLWKADDSRSGTAQERLLKILEAEASSRQLTFRKAMGPEISWASLAARGLAGSSFTRDRERLRAVVSAALGKTTGAWRAFGLSLAPQLDLFTGPWIAPLAKLSLDREETALLPMLLRHSYLVEATWAALRAIRARDGGRSKPVSWRDAEIHGSSTGRPTDPIELIRQAGEAGLSSDPDLRGWSESVARIGRGLSEQELVRLLGETLDLTSHRIDAWAEALAAQRLSEHRKLSAGSWVGAYGWLLELKRRANAAPSSDGWVHAPSLAQASTAAVLASGTVAGPRPSADATRAALDLHWQLSQSAAPGSVLTDRVLSLLAAGAAATSLPALATRFPVDPGSDWPFDGLAALADWQSNPTGAHWTSSLASARDAVRQVADEVDALSALVVGESVHQLLQGNVSGAGAALDALGRGGSLPALTHLRQSASGLTLTQRVALSLPDSTSGNDEWGARASTPRSIAEPRVDGWLASLFGSPGEATASFSVNEGATPTQISLAQLKLRPIDALALVQADPTGRALLAALASEAWASPTASTVRLLSQSPALRRFIALANLAVRTLDGTRPVTASDLRGPGDPAPAATPASSELEARLSAAAKAACDARASLEGRAEPFRRLRLLAAVDGRMPTEHLLGESAPARRASVETALAIWTEEWVEKCDGIGGSPAPADYDKLFSKFLRPVPACAELAAAAAGATSTLPNVGPADLKGRDVTAWVQGEGRARERLRAWRALEAGVRACGRGAAAPDWKVMQPAGTQWIAVPGAPPWARWSLAIAASNRSYGAFGLIIDEWDELQPHGKEMTGLAFHFDHPLAEAPQCLIVATSPRPPSAPGDWSVDWLWETLSQTLEMSKARLARPRNPVLSHLLPSVTIAENSDGVGISTPLSRYSARPTRSDSP